MRLISVFMSIIVWATPAAAELNELQLDQWSAASNMNVAQLEDACSETNQPACAPLGTRVLNGDGVAQDFRRAAETLYAACVEGEISWACHDYGVMWERGLAGGDANMDNAFQLYNYGCFYGAGEACRRGGDIAAESDDPELAEYAPSLHYSGCFKAQFPDPANCGRFARLVDEQAKTAPDTRALQLEALTQDCDPARFGGDGGCRVAKELCEAGDGEICQFYSQNRIEACQDGVMAACYALLNNSYIDPDAPNHAKVEIILAGAIAAANPNWDAVVETACYDHDDYERGCAIAQRACEGGLDAACIALAEKADFSCQFGGSNACDQFVSAGLRGNDLGEITARAWEFLEQRCSVFTGVCERMVRFYDARFDAKGQAADEQRATQLATDMCGVEDAFGCRFLADHASSETLKWQYMQQTCRGTNAVSLVGLPAHARLISDTCVELGDEVLRAAAASDGTHVDALLLRAQDFYKRGCSYTNSEFSNACLAAKDDSIDDAENDILIWTHTYADRNFSSEERQANFEQSQAEIGQNQYKSARMSENVNACAYYLNGVGESDDATNRQTCEKYPTRSYCITRSPVTLFGKSWYSCGNIQCMRDGANQTGRFALFDRVDRQRDAIVKACLDPAKRDPRKAAYLHDGTR